MKDVAGNEIKIGDKVATMLGGHTDALRLLKVIGFTDQKVRLQYFTGPTTHLKFPEQLCVVIPRKVSLLHRNIQWEGADVVAAYASPERAKSDEDHFNDVEEMRDVSYYTTEIEIN